MDEEIHAFTRDQNGVSNFEIDQIIQLDAVLKYNDVGAWSIQVPTTDAAIALAQPGMSAVIQGSNGWQISGPVTKIERDWGTTGTGSSDVADYFVISGVSDNTALWERVCWPCAASGAPPAIFSDSAHDNRSGPAESVMIDYVLANMGGGAWSSGSYANRKMPNLTFNPDQGRGSSVSYSARFDILGDLLQQIAIAGGGLGFDIVDDVFTVYEPRDLSKSAVFSADMGNLLAFQYSLDSPTATSVIVGGGDQDVLRTFVVGEDDVAQSLWRRIEIFHDQRGTTDPTQLSQTLETDLTNDAAQTGLSLRPIDIPTLSFGTDYRLGDLVTVDVDGQDITDVVQQVEITLDQNGEVVVPTIQSPTANGVTNALVYFQALRKLQRRVSSLERAL